MDKKQREDAINEVSDEIYTTWICIGSCAESDETSLYYHLQGVIYG